MWTDYHRFCDEDVDPMQDLDAFEGEYEAIAEIRSGFLCTVAE